MYVMSYLICLSVSPKSQTIVIENKLTRKQMTRWFIFNCLTIKLVYLCYSVMPKSQFPAGGSRPMVIGGNWW